MVVLGISGSVNRINEYYYQLPPCAEHDAAAAIFVDGELVAAIEEERLTRFKHAPKFPSAAVKFCLKSAGVTLDKVDRIAIYGSVDHWQLLLDANYFNKIAYTKHPQLTLTNDLRALFAHLISDESTVKNVASLRDKIMFYPHHLTHAASAYMMSGFDDTLIMTLDGEGDSSAGAFWHGVQGEINLIHTIKTEDSLGFLYLRVINYLGFKLFDEYKVMGLASYGDSTRYAEKFSTVYDLLPNGQWKIDQNGLHSMLQTLIKPRYPFEDILQEHKDIAAALQAALECIVLHALEYYRNQLQCENVCLAGGVSHNCSMNGKILYSGLFKQVFVQPAAHDAGCAVGAGLLASSANPHFERKRLTSLYLGSHIEDKQCLEQLSAWESLGFITFTCEKDICSVTAKLLAADSVIGWMQGRSEFGPRALGNRSILADPRPAENKHRINAIVKKRDGFRPFAPAVLEEVAREYFDIPVNVAQLPFMTTTVKCTSLGAETLKATTHVDNTARIQTVSKESNPLFWQLIKAFGEITNVSVLLNTSFNNNKEPIVNDTSDAIMCFLTTNLDYCVIGDYLIQKQNVSYRNYLELYPVMFPHWTTLFDFERVAGQYSPRYQVQVNCMGKVGLVSASIYAAPISVSETLYHILPYCSGKLSLQDILNRLSIYKEDEQAQLIRELNELCAERVIYFSTRKQ